MDFKIYEDDLEQSVTMTTTDNSQDSLMQRKRGRLKRFAHGLKDKIKPMKLGRKRILSNSNWDLSNENDEEFATTNEAKLLKLGGSLGDFQNEKLNSRRRSYSMQTLYNISENIDDVGPHGDSQSIGIRNKSIWNENINEISENQRPSSNASYGKTSNSNISLRSEHSFDVSGRTSRSSVTSQLDSAESSLNVSSLETSGNHSNQGLNTSAVSVQLKKKRKWTKGFTGLFTKHMKPRRHTVVVDKDILDKIQKGPLVDTYQDPLNTEQNQSDFKAQINNPNDQTSVRISDVEITQTIDVKFLPAECAITVGDTESETPVVDTTHQNKTTDKINTEFESGNTEQDIVFLDDEDELKQGKESEVISEFIETDSNRISNVDDIDYQNGQLDALGDRNIINRSLITQTLLTQNAIRDDIIQNTQLENYSVISQEDNLGSYARKSLITQRKRARIGSSSDIPQHIVNMDSVQTNPIETSQKSIEPNGKSMRRVKSSNLPIRRSSRIPRIHTRSCDTLKIPAGSSVNPVDPETSPKNSTASDNSKLLTGLSRHNIGFSNRPRIHTQSEGQDTVSVSGIRLGLTHRGLSGLTVKSPRDKQDQLDSGVLINKIEASQRGKINTVTEIDPNMTEQRFISNNKTLIHGGNPPIKCHVTPETPSLISQDIDHVTSSGQRDSPKGFPQSRLTTKQNNNIEQLGGQSKNNSSKKQMALKSKNSRRDQADSSSGIQIDNSLDINHCNLTDDLDEINCNVSGNDGYSDVHTPVDSLTDNSLESIGNTVRQATTGVNETNTGLLRGYMDGHSMCNSKSGVLEQTGSLNENDLSIMDTCQLSNNTDQRRDSMNEILNEHHLASDTTDQNIGLTTLEGILSPGSKRRLAKPAVATIGKNTSGTLIPGTFIPSPSKMPRLNTNRRKSPSKNESAVSAQNSNITMELRKLGNHSNRYNQPKNMEKSANCNSNDEINTPEVCNQTRSQDVKSTVNISPIVSIDSDLLNKLIANPENESTKLLSSSQKTAMKNKPSGNISQAKINTTSPTFGSNKSQQDGYQNVRNEINTGLDNQGPIAQSTPVANEDDVVDHENNVTDPRKMATELQSEPILSNDAIINDIITSNDNNIDHHSTTGSNETVPTRAENDTNKKNKTNKNKPEPPQGKKITLKPERKLRSSSSAVKKPTVLPQGKLSTSVGKTSTGKLNGNPSKNARNPSKSSTIRACSSSSLNKSPVNKPPSSATSSLQTAMPIKDPSSIQMEESSEKKTLNNKSQILTRSSGTKMGCIRIEDSSEKKTSNQPKMLTRSSGTKSSSSNLKPPKKINLSFNSSSSSLPDVNGNISIESCDSVCDVSNTSPGVSCNTTSINPGARYTNSINNHLNQDHNSASTAKKFNTTSSPAEITNILSEQKSRNSSSISHLDDDKSDSSFEIPITEGDTAKVKGQGTIATMGESKRVQPVVKDQINPIQLSEAAARNKNQTQTCDVNVKTQMLTAGILHNNPSEPKSHSNNTHNTHINKTCNVNSDDLPKSKLKQMKYQKSNSTSKILLLQSSLHQAPSRGTASMSDIKIHEKINRKEFTVVGGKSEQSPVLTKEGTVDAELEGIRINSPGGLSHVGLSHQGLSHKGLSQLGSDNISTSDVGTSSSGIITPQNPQITLQEQRSSLIYRPASGSGSIMNLKSTGKGASHQHNSTLMDRPTSTVGNVLNLKGTGFTGRIECENEDITMNDKQVKVRPKRKTATINTTSGSALTGKDKSSSNRLKQAPGSVDMKLKSTVETTGVKTGRNRHVSSSDITSKAKRTTRSRNVSDAGVINDDLKPRLTAWAAKANSKAMGNKVGTKATNGVQSRATSKIDAGRSTRSASVTSHNSSVTSQNSSLTSHNTSVTSQDTKRTRSGSRTTTQRRSISSRNTSINQHDGSLLKTSKLTSSRHNNGSQSSLHSSSQASHHSFTSDTSSRSSKSDKDNSRKVRPSFKATTKTAPAQKEISKNNSVGNIKRTDKQKSLSASSLGSNGTGAAPKSQQTTSKSQQHTTTLHQKTSKSQQAKQKDLTKQTKPSLTHNAKQQYQKPKSQNQLHSPNKKDSKKTVDAKNTLNKERHNSETKKHTMVLRSSTSGSKLPMPFNRSNTPPTRVSHQQGMTISNEIFDKGSQLIDGRAIGPSISIESGFVGSPESVDVELGGNYEKEADLEGTYETEADLEKNHEEKSAFNNSRYEDVDSERANHECTENPNEDLNEETVEEIYPIAKDRLMKPYDKDTTDEIKQLVDNADTFDDVIVIAKCVNIEADEGPSENNNNPKSNPERVSHIEKNESILPGADEVKNDMNVLPRENDTEEGSVFNVDDIADYFSGLNEKEAISTEPIINQEIGGCDVKQEETVAHIDQHEDNDAHIEEDVNYGKLQYGSESKIEDNTGTVDNMEHYVESIMPTEQKTDLDLANVSFDEELEVTEVNKISDQESTMTPIKSAEVSVEDRSMDETSPMGNDSVTLALMVHDDVIMNSTIVTRSPMALRVGEISRLTPLSFKIDMNDSKMSLENTINDDVKNSDVKNNDVRNGSRDVKDSDINDRDTKHSTGNDEDDEDFTSSRRSEPEIADNVQVESDKLLKNFPKIRDLDIKDASVIKDDIVKKSIRHKSDPTVTKSAQLRDVNKQKRPKSDSDLADVTCDSVTQGSKYVLVKYPTTYSSPRTYTSESRIDTDKSHVAKDSETDEKCESQFAKEAQDTEQTSLKLRQKHASEPSYNRGYHGDQLNKTIAADSPSKILDR
ncbi:unnamed protein product [Owenia fusiformis]|uniref:Uncharacterized protein n=1 Tax=Owenia fusiformis TaxID=6347 RepID=A0A8S4NHX0_OWEFU|nr:unnamed protein product [Owenia fusiformis]